MNIYDTARQLASEFKELSEFQEYKRLNEKIKKDQKNVDMIDDFRKKLLNYQLDVQKGKKDEEKEKELQNLQNVLMMNSEIAEFLMAEYKFSQTFEEVNKIIFEAIKMD